MTDDGGPAFPLIAEGGENSGLFPEFHSGMSLRDWFAGQALIGIYAGCLHMETKNAVKDAYETADAMLKERAKNDSPG